jgi:3-hydroxyisobutyrate dehydrogenase-like beta-hydroxyacid dehydrogenase
MTNQLTAGGDKTGRIPTVAIVAPGQMGSAVGKRLRENGVKIVTWLEGRSAESVARAQAASMTAVSLKELCEADIVLSIVPPGEAENLARQLAPMLESARKKPIYADCNAVNPRTVERIAAIVEATGTPFVDAGIIGGPPKAGYAGPIFYLSGERAGAVAALGDFGLACEVLEGPVGAASALKMSYAGITKGFTAIGAAMMLGAWRAGCGDELRQELSESQPQLHAWLTRQVPRMYPKAYRWVAEMEEIAAFLGEDEAARDMYLGIARLYERVAQGEAKESAAALRELDALSEFCASPAEWHGKTG